jgi:hypothetical protein
VQVADGTMRRRARRGTSAAARIAKAQDKVGYIAARLDLEEVERVRVRMPCAEHRVL